MPIRMCYEVPIEETKHTAGGISARLTSCHDCGVKGRVLYVCGDCYAQLHQRAQRAEAEVEAQRDRAKAALRAALAIVERLPRNGRAGNRDAVTDATYVDVHEIDGILRRCLDAAAARNAPTT